MDKDQDKKEKYGYKPYFDLFEDDGPTDHYDGDADLMAAYVIAVCAILLVFGIVFFIVTL